MEKDIRYGIKKVKGVLEVDYDKWIDLTDLKHIYGFGANCNKLVIDWDGSKGNICKFKYKDIEGCFKIISRNHKKQTVDIEFNKHIYTISSSNLIKCCLGDMIGVYTGDFKINVGQHIKDNKRNITILQSEYRIDKHYKNWKWYKYKCNECDNEDWVEENSLISNKVGCNVCSSNKVLLGVNTIWDTDRWMVDLGVSEEDAKKYTRTSGVKIEVTCPECKNKRRVIIGDIYYCKSIKCECGDGISYPEKFIYKLLKSVCGDNMLTQLNRTTFGWCGKYKYDFYIPLADIIIETHGEQHYNKKSIKKRMRTLEEEQENDRVKMELAIQNGIKPENYIVLDCRKSEFDWIVASIFSSRLFDLFDLSKIDFYKCEEFALGNLVKQICDYKKENPNVVSYECGKLFGLKEGTIRRYWKRGNAFGWCNYSIEEEKIRGYLKNRINVYVYDKNMIFIGKFNGVEESGRRIGKIYDTVFHGTCISAVCKGKRPHYKGFVFSYTPLHNIE